MYEARQDRRPRRSGWVTGLLGVIALVLPIGLAVLLVVLLQGGGGGHGGRTRPVPGLPRSPGDPGSHTVESIFQDDDHLIYSPTPVVARTLDTLRALGADRLRLTILWRAIAPAPGARQIPPGFDGGNPNAYPAAAWAPYDRIVRMAGARGLRVDFNLTAPGPLWAMAPGGADPAQARVADHLAPSVGHFGGFVIAVGRRYSGTFRPPGARAPLPRVSYWTVWNEPNQPGWLAPQRSGLGALVAPAAYRGLVDAAYKGLAVTGHTPVRDTILIGELAPEGSESSGPESAIPPMSFLRALYCVDDSLRPLRGAAATSVGCPAAGATESFVSAHPGLFRITGFAHHPYSFFLAPQATLTDPNFVPISELGTLEHGLDSIMTSYGQPTGMPLYLTEYGYETNPPNPFRGVSPKLQSLYLNQAEYLVWQDHRVRALSQFLLVDALPDTAYPRGSQRYWSTFQTGLEFASGAPKYALNSYRLPIFVPQTTFVPGRAVQVWGMLRLAPNGASEQALLQWRPKHGTYRTLQTLTTHNGSGFLLASLPLPGPGAVRLTWTAPSGQQFHSRAVGIS